MNDISVGEKKNMNLPGVKVDLPVLQARTSDLTDHEQVLGSAPILLFKLVTEGERQEGPA